MLSNIIFWDGDKLITSGKRTCWVEKPPDFIASIYSWNRTNVCALCWSTIINPDAAGVTIYLFFNWNIASDSFSFLSLVESAGNSKSGTNVVWVSIATDLLLKFS